MGEGLHSVGRDPKKLLQHWRTEFVRRHQIIPSNLPLRSRNPAIRSLLIA